MWKLDKMIDFLSPNITLRRRPNVNEAVPALNEKLSRALAEVEGYWDPRKAPEDASFDCGPESSTLDLRKCVLAGLSGQISYESRIPDLIRDHGMSDDTLDIYFDPDIFDVPYFMHNVLPRLITIFGPYRGQFSTDAEVAGEYWQEVCELSDYGERETPSDGRHDVYRFWPVNFFDDLLCRRAFGMSAKEVVARAANECAVARLIDGGAFLIVTDDLVLGKENLQDLHQRLNSALKV